MKKASLQPSEDLLTNSVKKKKRQQSFEACDETLSMAHLARSDLPACYDAKRWQAGQKSAITPIFVQRRECGGIAVTHKQLGTPRSQWSDRCYVNVRLHTTASDEGVTSCEVITEGKKYQRRSKMENSERFQTQRKNLSRMCGQFSRHGNQSGRLYSGCFTLSRAAQRLQ